MVRGGRRATRDGLVVYAATRPDEAPARLGLIVAGNVGPAVVRNRIRRRLRAIWRAAPPRPGVDVVVRALPDAVGRAYQELEDHLTAALTDATRST